jgi:hypothetical protein
MTSIDLFLADHRYLRAKLRAPAFAGANFRSSVGL